MPDLSDTVAKCRMGTAKKFYTSIASLSHINKWYRQQTHKGLPDTENKKRGISWHKTWNASFLRLISQNIEKNLVIFPIYRYKKLKYNELRKNAKIIYFREERGNAAKDSI